MQIQGLIPFKSSIDQAIASLYFLRIYNSFCSSSLVNVVEIILGLAVSNSRKAYSYCLGNSFKVNPSVLVSVSFASSSLLDIFSILFSFILKTVSFNLQLECRNSKSRSSRNWKFISFSLVEL